MEQKRNLVLAGTETFSKGGLDNVALEDGCIVLDGVAGRHMPYGCYTTPEFAMPPFCSLNVSWNADTPARTVIEAQCRVLAGGAWSSWMSFGKWSPDYPRKSASPPPTKDGLVFVLGDTVTVAVAGGATAVQLRMNLYSDDEKSTPAIRLLAAAVRPIGWEKQDGRPANRRLFLPDYRTENHPTRFGGSMDLPLTVAALINRYGTDVLPEELAFGMADGTTGLCANAAYAAAIAGACGYRCWQVWADLRELRAEVRAGFSAAVELERRPGAPRPEKLWAGLFGFEHDEGRAADMVLLRDPDAPAATPYVRLSAEEFKTLFTGRALLLRPKARGVPGIRPLRSGCRMRGGEGPGEYLFERRGELWTLPEGFTGWAACSPYDEVAHATTADRTFLPMAVTPGGGVTLPPGLPGGRCTLYAVDETGALRVAELRVAAPEPAPAAVPPDKAADAPAPPEKQTGGQQPGGAGQNA